MQTLTTEDGQAISYAFYPSKQGGPGAILLHQLRRDHHDYDSFAPQLKDAGYNVIAIDVRGHGHSSGNWEKFSLADFQRIGLDIAAAKEFLAEHGTDTSKLVLIGASFTANAVINHSANDDDVKGVIAISPGLDFKGIRPEQGIARAPTTLLIAAEDDSYSADTVRKLHTLNPDTDIKIYPVGGHAHALFEQAPMAKDILGWLRVAIK